MSLKLLSVLVLPLVMACGSVRGTGSRLDLAPAPADSTARGDDFVVASPSARASRAAKLMMEQGGNIVDAFVATSFVLAVEMPYATGIGGGGFLLFRHAPSKNIYAFDFREVAPKGSSKKMYLDEQGGVRKEASKTGALAAGIPGFVAGVLEVHNLYGKLPRAKVLEPAIKLAKEGFAVGAAFAKRLKDHQSRLIQYRGSRDLFFKDGKILKQGDLFRQTDLAKTIEEVASKGRDGFYKGQIAWSIVLYMNANDGVFNIRDMIGYRPKVRKPVKGEYDGYTIYGMPPPSSGGILVQQILNMLKHQDLSDGAMATSTIHKTASAMQLAFADRGRYFGDADFVKMPIEGMLSDDYAKKRSAQIDPMKAKASKEVGPGDFPGFSAKDHTVHFSMADSDGNVISSTQTINGGFGNAMVVPSTGVLMNNEMDDFSAKAAALNMFGAYGSNANLPEAKKRPLSSMSPTIIMRGDSPYWALGSPNGTRIISCVTLAALNLMEHGMSLEDAIAAPRYHHQWIPDQLWVETTMPEHLQEAMKAKGHKLKVRDWGCKVAGVSARRGRLRAVTDPRGPGLATGL